MPRYFAELNDEDIVQRVIVADSLEWCEQNLGGTWVETFTDEPNRNYAAPGYRYHPDSGNFSCKKPFDSWSLDERCNWKAPKEKPAVDAKKENAVWNEPELRWDKVESPFVNKEKP